MDILKFLNPNSPTLMEQALVVNGLTSKTWIERYRDACEFKFEAPVSAGVQNVLTRGSLISHQNTSEIMIVEDHEINEVEGEDAIVTITGRSFETILENRIVQINTQIYPNIYPKQDYSLPTDWTWNQVGQLISTHILAEYLVDDNYALPNVAVLIGWGGAADTTVRNIKRVDVYSAILEIMKVDNIGIKNIRPGPWSPLEPGFVHGTTIYSDSYARTDIAMMVYKGVDRTSQVVFSNTTGELVSADYFWSNRKIKNAALVLGTWVEVVVNPSPLVNGYNRRMMIVDATDVDKKFTDMPTGSDYDDVLAGLNQRGLDALKSQSDIVLTKPEISKDNVGAKFRTDYNVGDLITVQGDYNQLVKMRITEYVEIEDENGEVGYPTLSLD